MVTSIGFDKNGANVIELEEVEENDYSVLNTLQMEKFCESHGKDMIKNGFGIKENGTQMGTILMLVVSELGEALEAHRKSHHSSMKDFLKILKKEIVDNEEVNKLSGDEQEELTKIKLKKLFEENIKDSFEDEIADTFLRLMHLCYEEGIDIENHIRYKKIYNSLRPYKHGKEY